MVGTGISADCTAKCELLSVFRVLHLQGTVVSGLALRQLVLGLAGDIVPGHLLLMARLTEMGVAPTEPLRN